MKKSFRGTRVHPIGRPNLTLRSLLPYRKDPITRLDCAGTVYSIPCSEPTCSTTYIGQTKRLLRQRLAEHQRAVNKKDIHSRALAQHASEHLGHTPAWDEVRILYKAPFYHERLLKESWAIIKTPDLCNRQHERGSIPAAFSTALHANELRENPNQRI